MKIIKKEGNMKNRENKEQQLLQKLLTGRRFTAIQLNFAINTSDTRKYISVLRRKGHIIRDEVIDQESGTKVYWLEKKVGVQLSLF